MELFHVWLKYYRCSDNRWHEQRLITFVDREAADEWWRSISVPSSSYAGQVKRISPQLYVQIQGEDIWDSIYKDQSPETRHLCERMIASCRIDSHRLDQPVTILAPASVTDHISGRWYFIRSKADPFSHWYIRTAGGRCAVCGDTECDAVHVSSDSRTRFCVRVRNNPEVPDDFVMIGTDEIAIAAPKGHILHISDAGDVKGTRGYQGETDLLFGDLKKRFVARTEKQVNGELWEYVESVERGVGEVWELVE